MPWPLPRNWLRAVTVWNFMIAIFSYWTFHLYEQHSSTTCIWSVCLSVDPIFQSLCFLSWFLWQRVATNKEATEPSVPSDISRNHNHYLGNRYRISVTNDHWYVPFVIITILFFPHSWLITRFFLQD